MPLFNKLLKPSKKKNDEAQEASRDERGDDERRDEDTGRGGGAERTEEDRSQNDGTKIVYFALETPRQDIIDALTVDTKEVHVSSYSYFLLQ
jgi:hypothetical protein